jgi:hypothetical protein
MAPGWTRYSVSPGGFTYVERNRHMERDPLLQERQKTHGSFEQNAKISQQLKMIYSIYGYPKSDAQREALDMIALKLSRILSGQANHKDHWDDIAGYAKLASEACPSGEYVMNLDSKNMGLRGLDPRSGRD